MKEEDSKCVVRRVGVIKTITPEAVLITIQGKSIQVPVDKAASGLQVGNEVTWSGVQWVLAN